MRGALHAILQLPCEAVAAQRYHRFALAGLQDAGQQHSYLQAFFGAMHGVFLLAAAITSVAFALSWLLREVPLRKATQG